MAPPPYQSIEQDTACRGPSREHPGREHGTKGEALSTFRRQITKVQKNKGAVTTVEQLSNDDRVLEVARIIGGIKITNKARRAAEEMIKKSA